MTALTESLLLVVGKVVSLQIKNTFKIYERAIVPDILSGILEADFSYNFERLFYDRVHSLKLSADVIEKKEFNNLIEGFGVGVGYSKTALQFKLGINKADSAVIKESGYTADHFEQPQGKCKAELIKQNKNKKPWTIDEYVEFYIRCGRVNLVTKEENNLLSTKKKPHKRLYYSDVYGEDRQLKIYDISGKVIDVDSPVDTVSVSLMSFFK
tara:strand:- start:880 stop:1512 length:633 start_codon:yes stop_codon:yes gene_type:complete